MLVVDQGRGLAVHEDDVRLAGDEADVESDQPLHGFGPDRDEMVRAREDNELPLQDDAMAPPPVQLEG